MSTRHSPQSGPGSCDGGSQQPAAGALCEGAREPIVALLVEHDRGDADAVAAALERAGGGFRLERVGPLTQALPRLAAGGIDVVLLDFDLPDCTGESALEALRSVAPDTPVIAVTPAGSAARGPEALQAGAADYLAKAGFDAPALEKSIRYAMARRELAEAARALAQERAAREAAQAEARKLADSQAAYRRVREQLALALKAGHSGAFDWDPKRNVNVWSPEVLELHGMRPGEFGGRYEDWLECVVPEDRAKADAAVRRSLETESYDDEFRIRRRDTGEVRWMHSRGKMFVDAEGRPARLIGINEDITDRKRHEEELRRTHEQLRVSEERYRLVNLATHDVLWDWDLANGQIEWNEALQATFGYSVDAPRGLSWWSAKLHPKDGARVEGSLFACIADPTVRSWSCEYRFRHCDGQWVDVLDRGFVVRDAQGHAVRMIGSMVDVTERKRAEAALRRSREEFRLLADAMPQLVWTNGPEANPEFFNRHFCEYTGLTLEAAGRESWIGLLHPDDVPRTLQRWHHSLRTGEPYESEHRLRSARDGTCRWFLARALPLRDDAGRVVRWFGTCTDIDDQKRAEVELEQEKTRLSVILAQLPVGVLIADAEGRIVETNAWAHEIWRGDRFPSGPEAYRGRSTETGRPLGSEDWALTRALRHGERVIGQVIDVTRSDGSQATILNNAAPFQDAEGRVTGAVDVFSDLTELRRAQQALRESEDKYRALFENMALGCSLGRVVLDDGDRPVDFVFEEINAAFEAQTGLRCADILGRRATEVLSSQGCEGWVEMFGEVAATGRAIHGERFLASIGRWIEVTAYRPKPGHCAVLFLDVTARKQAEKALERANEQLLLADRHKNNFLGMLAHELRNPLTPIRNSLHLLDRTTPGGPQARRALGVIARQVGHMNRLIDDLLDVTRISRGKIQLTRDRVELGELVRHAAEDHRSLFDERGVSLEVATSDEALFTEADPTRLAQVIGNLLGNALKYTARGGRVRLSLGTERGWAAIRVRDDGAGIHSEALARIFRPFEQADETRDVSRGGLGLGLALVKGLVEAHGGTVAASSEGPGKGAEFVARVPLVRAPAPETVFVPAPPGG